MFCRPLPGADKRISASDGGKRARSPGRARRKPLKPLRAGMPGDPGATVVKTRVLSTLRTRGCGCSGHPAFPTPSRGRKINAQLGRFAPRDREVVSGYFVIASEAKQSIAPRKGRMDCFVASLLAMTVSKHLACWLFEKLNRE